MFSQKSGYQRSQVGSQAGSKRPSIFSKASSRVKREEALKQITSARGEEQKEPETKKIEEADIEVAVPDPKEQEAELEAQELQDKVEELLDLPKTEDKKEEEEDKLTSVSQLKPTAS